MTFNSLHFTIFFALIFTLSWILVRWPRARQALLLLASYYFYLALSWKYVVLVIASTLVDFVVGLGLARAAAPRQRRLLLALSIACNLGALAIFKYANFFLGSVYDLLASLGCHVAPHQLSVLLPVGISFYTFKTLTYTIGVYRREIEPTRDLLHYALFVAFFPQLLAGPIARAGQFLPQLRQTPAFDDHEALLGLAQVFRGLIKKMALADLLSVALVDPVYADPTRYAGWTNLLASYGYALQIYCDFSGYSDVAIGAARLLGFSSPLNFNRPYLALGVRDFWARWHISLSTWLRDYLYIPLGGNRRGTGNTYRNLFLTMFLGGLWHGAAWHFVAWGAFHGAWLILARVLGRDRRAEELSAVARWGRRLLTFHLVCVGWILFRADTLHDALLIGKQILTWAPGPTLTGLHVWVPLLVGYAAHGFPLEWLDGLQERFTRLPAWCQGGVYAAVVVCLIGVGGAEVPFVYFQF